MFGVMSIVTASSILPVNILGTMGAEGLNSLSIGNVDGKSQLLWVHVGVFALMVVWVLWGIVGEMRIYTHLRMWWLTHPDNKGPGTSTILISDVPPAMRDEKRLAELFAGFPGGVRQTLVNRSTKELAETVDRRNELAGRLEKVLSTYALQCSRASDKSSSDGGFVEPPRPRMFTGLPLCSKRVDAVEYLAAEIAMCNHFIARSKQDPGSLDPQPSALVRFNSQIAAHMAEQVVLDHVPFSMSRVSTSANARDVIWDNLHMGPWSRRLRGYLSFSITVALIMVWTVVTAVLSGLVQVEALAGLEQFAWLRGNSLALGTFSGIVPSAVLAVLMAILPKLLRLLLVFEGCERYSKVGLRLLHRLYFFQVWNVYLVTIFSSSILQIAAKSVQEPGRMVELIQTQVPQSATNILTYILLLSFIGAAREIIQGVPLALRYLRPTLAKTPRQLQKAEAPREFDWASGIPTHSLIFLMGFSYAFIAPIVNWFVAVYFGLFYVIYRYQFLYVYDDAGWTTGGLSFPKSVKQMLVGIYISETYMLLMMVAKLDSSASAILRVVVSSGIIVFTVGAHLYISDVYMPAIRSLPVKRAVDVERNPLMATEFPNVLYSEESDTRRNRIYAMYSSLVPPAAIRFFLRIFSSSPKPLDEWDNSSDEETMAGFEYTPRSFRASQKSIGCHNPDELFTDPDVLVREFSSPQVRALPVCNLWVPLGNSQLFAKLLWEVEYHGQGTIFVITQGTRISAGRLSADLDFLVERAEVHDKNELAVAQRQRLVAM
ncbi:phosphate metabolism protein 7 [Coemansia sp. RSA 552]|nr:phosphate metabolism protein 7 [Coemansia sp. RSA 552]